MVKNTKGGKGAKSLGRKFQNQPKGGLRESSNDLEKYAYISKMFGNGMCQAIYIDEDNKEIELIAHIRNKFRRRQKRSNTITANSIVLIGMREFETIQRNCDILTIYDDNDVKQLKADPKNNIEKLEKMNPANRNINTSEDDFEFTFSNDDNNDNNIFENHTDDVNKEQSFITDGDEEINIDDI